MPAAFAVANQLPCNKISPPSGRKIVKYSSTAGALNCPVGKPVPEPLPTAGAPNGSFAILAISKVPALVFEIVIVLDPAVALTLAPAVVAAELISLAI